jgi:hypothetical protein
MKRKYLFVKLMPVSLFFSIAACATQIVSTPTSARTNTPTLLPPMRTYARRAASQSMQEKTNASLEEDS